MCQNHGRSWSSPEKIVSDFTIEKHNFATKFRYDVIKQKTFCQTKID